MLSFKPVFFTFLFHPIKRLFSSSSVSAIGEVSSAYLRLLIFLPAILIPACDSSSLVFCMMYSTHKLNKQPLWSCSHSPSLMTWMWQQRRLTLASPPPSVARAGCECGEDAPSGCAGLCVHLDLSLGSVCQSRGLPAPWALPWE